MKKFTIIFCLSLCCFKYVWSQPCKLDSSFGANGIVKTDFGYSNDNNYATTGRQVLLQKDKKLNILIESSGQSYIARLLENGDLDVSYGNNGFSSPASISQAVAAMQKDGKIVIAGSDPTNTFAVARFNADGTIDNTFNGNGKQRTDFGSGYNIANAIAIQEDGKIVVAGYADIGNSIDFAVVRYNSDGTNDDSFSKDGKQTTNFDSKVNYANSVAIQKDGKIVLAGQSYGKTFSDFAVVRYNSNGSLDNSFSNDGKQTTDFDLSDDIGKSVIIQNDGKIIVSGYEYKTIEGTNSAEQFAAVRYNTNGTVDNSFNKDGKTVTSFNTGYFATSIALQTNGQIVMAGYTFEDNAAFFALARFNTDGSLDTEFGTGGRLTTSINGYDFAYSVAIQEDGKIVAAGLDYGDNFDVARYLSDGHLDNTFSRGGKLTDRLRLNQGSTYFTSSAIQQDGKLVAAGYAWNGSNYDFALARYNSDGTPDNNFSQDGKQTTDFSSGDDHAYSIAIQEDGKILLAGITASGFALARYNTDGSPDMSFGSKGKKITSFGTDQTAIAKSVAIQQDGKIVVAGYTYISEQVNEDFAVARYNTNGSSDNTFAQQGKLTTDLGFNDFANAVAIQKDGKIIVAGNSVIDTRGENISFFALTRYNTNGTPDISFGEDGKQFTMPDQFGGIQSVAIQDDGKIVAAGFSSASDNKGENFAVARYNINGNPDNTFNNTGIKISDLGSESEYANSVAIQQDGKIIVGGSSDGNFALTRLTTGGKTDNTFGKKGITITEVSGQQDLINQVEIYDNKLYAVGFGEFPGNLGVAARYLLTDESKPVLTLSIPDNIVKYTGPATIKLNAAITNQANVIKKVRFYQDSIIIHTEDVFPYGYLWKNVSEGTYKITAKATDAAGNVITSNSIVVSVVNYDVAPFVSIVTPVNDTTYAGPATIRLIAKAKDPNDKINEVEFFNGTELLRTEYYYPYTYTWLDVQPGTYSITARATDSHGISALSKAVSVTVTAADDSRKNKKSLMLSKKEGLNEAIDLRLGPNPASNLLQVLVKDLPQKGEFDISVISAAGTILKTIRSSALAATAQIDVSSLRSGVYTLRFIYGNKILFKQFVKL